DMVSRPGPQHLAAFRVEQDDPRRRFSAGGAGTPHHKQRLPRRGEGQTDGAAFLGYLLKEPAGGRVPNPNDPVSRPGTREEAAIGAERQGDVRAFVPRHNAPFPPAQGVEERHLPASAPTTEPLPAGVDFKGALALV